MANKTRKDPPFRPPPEAQHILDALRAAGLELNIEHLGTEEDVVTGHSLLMGIRCEDNIASIHQIFAILMPGMYLGKTGAQAINAWMQVTAYLMGEQHGVPSDKMNTATIFATLVRWMRHFVAALQFHDIHEPRNAGLPCDNFFLIAEDGPNIDITKMPGVSRETSPENGDGREHGEGSDKDTSGPNADP